MSNSTRRRLLAAGTAAACLLVPLAACLAQPAPPAAGAGTDYPSRTIRIVVPFAPGGGGDVLGRLLAQKLGDAVHQPVIVDNKPGASSIVATDFVAKSAPDGYTVLLNVPLLVQTAALYTKLPYNPLTDLVPVTDLVTSPLWFAVGTAKVPATTLKAYVADAKANPRDYNFASIGAGSSGHLLGQALSDANGLTMTHVPYKGSAPAMMGLLSGEITAVFLDYVTLKPQVEQGKVRLLAVTGTTRTALTPDVVARLEAEVRRITQQPDFVARIRDLGYEPGGSPQARFTATVRADYDRWGALIRKAGVKLD